MALNFTDLQFPMAQGLDRGTDEKLAQGPQKVENAEWVKEGSLTKRRGTVALSTTIISGSSFSGSLTTALTASVDSLDDVTNVMVRETTNGINQLVIETSGSVASLASGSIWSKVGNSKRLSTSTRGLIAGANSRIAMSSDSAEGLRLIGASEIIDRDAFTNVDIHQSKGYVLDSNTDALITKIDFASGGDEGARYTPQILKHESDTVPGDIRLNAFFIEGATPALYGRYIDTATPYAWSPKVTIQSDIAYADKHVISINSWDKTATIDDGIMIASLGSSGSIAIQVVNHDLQVVSASAWTGISDADDMLDARQIGTDAYVLYRTNADEIKVAQSKFNLNLQAVGTVEANAENGTTIWAIRGVSAEANSSVIQYLVEWESRFTDSDGNYLDDNQKFSYVRPYVVQTSNLAVTTADDIQHCMLLNRPFQYNNKWLTGILYNSPVQSVGLIADFTGSVWGEFARDSINRTDFISNTEVLDSTKFGFLYGSRGRLEAANGKQSQRTQISYATLNFDPDKAIWSNPQHLLYQPRGRAKLFDGETNVEAGFTYFPEMRSWPGTSLINDPNPTFVTSSGAISAGTRQYYSTYHWTDREGNEHRSAPSVPAQLVVNSPFNVTINVPSLSFTDKDDVKIKIWRTENNGLIPYLITSGSSELRNDKTASTVSFVDKTTDANIIANEILYTAGGELANQVPPPSKLSVIWNNRLITVVQDSTLIYYTKPLTISLAPEFSEFLTVDVDLPGGNLTAIGTLDEKLIVFNEDRIAIVTGQPADANGLGSTLRVQGLTSEIGCVNPASVVEASKLGLLFESKKGLYLLDRGLNVRFIGDSIQEDIKDETIVSAGVIKDQEQIRFLTLSGKQFVFNTRFQRWSTFEGIGANAAAIYNGEMAFASGSSLFQHVSGTYTDNGTAYSMKYQSPWIKLSGLAGFQRVQRATFLGTFLTDHVLELNVEYDFDESNSRNYTSTEQVSNFVNAASGSIYEWAHHLREQKCQAIRFTLSDTIQSGSQSSFELQGMRLKVGTKRGHDKLSSGKKIS